MTLTRTLKAALHTLATGPCLVGGDVSAKAAHALARAGLAIIDGKVVTITPAGMAIVRAKRGPGRPTTGGSQFTVNVSPELHRWLKRKAADTPGSSVSAETAKIIARAAEEDGHE